METRSQEERIWRSCGQASGLALAGILLSGPVVVPLLAVLSPQPAWQSPELFAAHFAYVQTAPYFAGFAMIGGFLWLFAGLHQAAPPERRLRTRVALSFGSAYAALIFFNYIVQTTFVPSLTRPYAPQSAELIATFSMANPRSLAWAVEMWAYGLLGVATWLAAAAFGSSRLERTTALLYAANGPVSLAGGIWTALEPGWVQTTPGLVAFVGWNALVVAMVGCTWEVARRRRSDAARPLPRGVPAGVPRPNAPFA